MKNEEQINEILKQLEEINLESLEYRRTRNFLKYRKKETGKKILKEKGLVKYLYNCFKMNQILKMNKIESKNNGTFEYDKVCEDKKVIVYTAIIGKYDNVLEPVYVPSNCKYVLFTDNKDINTDKWEIREIPDNIKKLGSNILINRYIKMHPRELFEDMDYSIYIDGNIKTIGNIRELLGAANTQTGLAIHRHSVRNCIYEEAKICMLFRKGNFNKLRKQLNRYRKEAFPKQYGLLECNVIITNLKNVRSEEILNEWWNEFIKTESYRDQIALPYVLWKMGYNLEKIGNLGNNIYLNSKFKVVEHK